MKRKLTTSVLTTILLAGCVTISDKKMDENKEQMRKDRATVDSIEIELKKIE